MSRFLVQHHTPVFDRSQGFAAAAGGVQPTIYARAQDAPDGAISTWTPFIGSSPFTATATPTKNGTGWGGAQATIDFVSADLDTVLIGDGIPAAHEANSNRPFSFAVPVIRDTASTGIVLGFGNTATNQNGIGVGFVNTGEVYFESRRGSGTLDNTLSSVLTVPIAQRGILAVSVTPGGPLRAKYLSGASAEVTMFDTTTTALSNADYNIASLALGRMPRILNPFAFSGKVGGLVAWFGTAFTLPQLLAIGERYRELYPTT